MKNNIKSVGAVLDKIIRDVNLQEPYYFHLLKERWAEAVGETLAVISWPVALENKILSLKVKDENWKKEFEAHKQDIIKKVLEYLKNKTEINDITLI